MLGVIDVKAADVDVDGRWNGVGAAAHLDGMRDDRNGAAAFDARRLLGVLHMDRNVDADRRALAEPHEVNMQRKIANGIELEVARNDAMLHAVDLNVMNSRQEMPGIDSQL